MSPDDPVTKRIFEACDEICWEDMAVLSFPGNPVSDGERGSQK